MLCSEWDGVKPDILVLGKALSGGALPVSAVLASDEVRWCCCWAGLGWEGCRRSWVWRARLQLPASRSPGSWPAAGCGGGRRGSGQARAARRGAGCGRQAATLSPHVPVQRQPTPLTTHRISHPTNQIMLTIGRGQHGSTYGGNPVAARTAIAALKARAAALGCTMTAAGGLGGRWRPHRRRGHQGAPC